MSQKRPRPIKNRPPELRLYAPFSPPGADKRAATKELAAFLELYAAARSLRTTRKAEALREKELHFQKLSPVIEQTLETFRSRAAGTIDQETAQRKLREICPDEKTRMEIIQFLWPILEERLDMTSEERAAQRAGAEQALATKGEELEKRSELLEAWEQARLALEVVSSQVLAGGEKAIEDAAAIAEQAILLLVMAEKLHPAAVRRVAAGRMAWPLLGSREPDWARGAAVRIESLQLGSGPELFHTRFRQPRGSDENHPARQWAKQAVRVLEETRLRRAIYADYRSEFEDLILEGKIDRTDFPGWVDAALKVPVFSSASARQWGQVIREMIREQAPDFHTAPEWSNQRNNAKRNCRDSRGEIQNAILDDIVSALSRLAPERDLPKLEC